MTTYLLGSLTKDLLDPDYIPVGIVVRDGENVEVRIVDVKKIEEKYIPDDLLSKRILANLEEIFKEINTPSGYPTNLYFSLLNLPEKPDDLSKLADDLFAKDVLSHYS